MKRYFVRSFFSPEREVTKNQHDKWCEWARTQNTASTPEQREEFIRKRTRIEEGEDARRYDMD